MTRLTSANLAAQRFEIVWPLTLAPAKHPAKAQPVVPVPGYRFYDATELSAAATLFASDVVGRPISLDRT